MGRHTVIIGDQKEIRVLTGDAAEVLRGLESGSVHCCVTSPPYWNQRDYEVAGQIGRESSPLGYFDSLRDVFAEVKRVLRDDGTLWINIGDTFIGKQLACLPFELATALQQDGWILRQDIIWHKPNPMPESVTNRFTKSHEYVFLFTKASSGYFFDAEAVAEKSADHNPLDPPTRNRRSVWTISTKPYKGAHFATMPPELAEICIQAGTSRMGACYICGSQCVRQVKRIRVATRPGNDTKVTGNGKREGNRDPKRHVTHKSTVGWEFPCRCNRLGHPVPSVVLDPFAGSGTTLAVAAGLGLDAIGIELNTEYVPLIEQRVKKAMEDYKAKGVESYG